MLSQNRVYMAVFAPHHAERRKRHVWENPKLARGIVPHLPSNCGGLREHKKTLSGGRAKRALQRGRYGARSSGTVQAPDERAR